MTLIKRLAEIMYAIDLLRASNLEFTVVANAILLKLVCIYNPVQTFTFHRLIQCPVRRHVP